MSEDSVLAPPSSLAALSSPSDGLARLEPDGLARFAPASDGLARLASAPTPALAHPVPLEFIFERIPQTLRWVRFEPRAKLSFLSPTTRAANRAGLVYEARVAQQLTRRYLPQQTSIQLLLNPWIRYADENGSFWAQPDALIVRPDRVDIIETKLSHTTRAWFQLRKIYEPLVRALFPERPIRLVEIVKNSNEIVFPEPLTWEFSLDALDTAHAQAATGLLAIRLRL